MDEFHVGSIPPYDRYRDQEPSGSAKRKKPKRHEGDPPEQDKDDEVALSGESDQPAEPGEDYFTPSPRDEEESS